MTRTLSVLSQIAQAERAIAASDARLRVLGPTLWRAVRHTVRARRTLWLGGGAALLIAAVALPRLRRAVLRQAPMVLSLPWVGAWIRRVPIVGPWLPIFANHRRRP